MIAVGSITPKVVMPSVVARLAGDAPVSTEAVLHLSDWLRVEIYELTDPTFAEDTGRLICLPFDDETFGIQIAFSILGDDGSCHIVVLHVDPQFLAQWPADVLHAQQAFRFDHSAEHELRLDNPCREILTQFLEDNTDEEFSGKLHFMEYSLQLLRRATEQLRVPFAACVVPACRFLAYESEREKIHQARAYLDEHFDEKLSIKELARKVAMNECYLKKGFKTITGHTIHDYIAARRIGKARHLLQVEHKSVTEVSVALGYSSISHFSTAFKKATGLKPCELLG
ncbi:MAG: AraC family transcriptional regulator [Chitinophagaceae bacterium]